MDGGSIRIKVKDKRLKIKDKRAKTKEDKCYNLLRLLL